MGCTKRRHDGHLAETNSVNDNASYERRQVVFVAMTDFFDQPMATQAFEQPRKPAAGFAQTLSYVFF